MSDLQYKNTNYVPGTEIVFDAPVSVQLGKISLELRTTATVGNRQMALEVRASSKAIFALLNQIKAKFYALLAKLDADTGVTSTAFAAIRAVVPADATSLATGYTLANAIKADHNAVLTILNGDTGVTDTNYVATMAVAAADATTQLTLATLVNELRAQFDALLAKLDADILVNSTDYRPTLTPTLAALTTAITTNASAVVAASKTMLLSFAPNTADGTVANRSIHTNLAAGAVTIRPTESLYIYDRTNVAALDRLTVTVEARRN
jgi:hypothetical protein